MEMSNSEMMKLFDFILENKNIIIGNNGLFSRDTLTMIRAIVKGRIPNNFQLTPEQEQLLIDAFLDSNNIFNEDTPSFIIENEACVKVTIARDLDSVNFIQNLSPELKEYVISKAIDEGFILRKKSPEFLKVNYNVALNSIILEASSADFINWYAMKDEEADNLVDEVIKSGYVLSSNSHSFLRENIKIVLDSIKKDKENIQYAKESAKNNPEVFKYLLLNGYHFDNCYLRARELRQILDKDVLSNCFNQLGVYDHNNEIYIDRFSTIFNIAINSRPSIKTFESVFQTVAEAVWKEYREDNLNDFENIFGKICTELRNADDFNRALRNLSFLRRMEKTLEDKYSSIYKAMEEYFILYHSDTSRKLEKMQPYQDVIAKYSALYVSKRKEEYKKNELNEYYEWLKPYFTLRLDNPLINKRVIQAQKKEVFKYLYQSNDENVCTFINSIAQAYSQQEDKDIVCKLIDGFVIQQHSKIESIIESPYKYHSYERYENAIKLIRRLNSGYIRYDGTEVYNYRDIIKYDDIQKQYVYTGVNFDDNDLARYSEFRKKARLFEKIKKDITLKIRTMEINTEIDDDIVDKLAAELPFTDEYFVFDNYNLEYFDLNDLCKSCMNSNYEFSIESFVSDDSFALLNNLLINNGMIWLLLFSSRDSNYSLSRNGVETNNIVKLINNIKKMADLAKEFTFNTTKFDELLLLNEMSKCADAEAIAILGKDIIEKLYTFKEYTASSAKDIISMAKELVAQMVKRSKSTVPFVSGETINYKYSIYDSQDETLLLAGINTDACFRIDGNDNDFLHYCALDKNGFVIKITDSYGNFMARASGFRNGNCVFLNQLRTIYDQGGNYYLGKYENEKNDIIETLRSASEDIVNISHKNSNEIDKIDFVFITKSYSLKDIYSNVPDDVTDQIGDYPMDTDSEDWEEFVNNTINLLNANDCGNFITDYGEYPLICMASSKRRRTLKPRDIKPKNVPAVYERTRNHIMATEHADINIFNKINKINGINSYLAQTKFKSVSIPEGSAVFMGDNWYIIYYCGSIISSCVLDFDKKAKVEFELTKSTLEQYALANKQQINVIEALESQTSKEPEGYASVLKIYH